MNRKKEVINRPEEIEILLGNPPSWLTRWGILVIVSIILILLIGSYFFRYPEKTACSIVITTEHPAIWLVAKSNGRIDSIYVKDQSKVDRNQIIATLESTATLDDVLRLKNELELLSKTIEEDGIDSLSTLLRSLNVGELNDSYNQLIKSIDNYILFTKEKYHKLKIESLQTEKERKNKYLQDIERQNQSYLKYSDVVKSQFLRDSLLYTKNTISKKEFETAQKEKITSDIQLYQSFSNLSAAQLEILQINQQITEISIDFNERKKNYYNNLKATYELLYNNILVWENTYIIKNPSVGKISFLKFWSKNQYVNSGEKIFAVIPDDYGAIIGKCYVKTSGIGKVKEGQKVTIKLDEYPYMEYGMIIGQVSNISLIGIEASENNRYAIVEIRFNQKELKSTYNKSIDFKGELTGSAEIETQQMSLLEHLINPLKYLWSNVE